jgi:hypothetical protein
VQVGEAIAKIGAESQVDDMVHWSDGF